MELDLKSISMAMNGGVVDDQYKVPLIAKLLHSLPHYNITFHRTNNTFRPTDEVYLEVSSICTVTILKTISVPLQMQILTTTTTTNMSWYGESGETKRWKTMKVECARKCTMIEKERERERNCTTDTNNEPTHTGNKEEWR